MSAPPSIAAASAPSVPPRRVTVEQFEPAHELLAYCALAGLPVSTVNARFVRPHDTGSLPRLVGGGVALTGDRALAWLRTAHPVDCHLHPDAAPLVGPLTALAHGPLRAVADWAAFADGAAFARGYGRAAKAQLSWAGAALQLPALLRQSAVRGLAAAGWGDEGWVKQQAIEAYTALAKLLDTPLPGAPANSGGRPFLLGARPCSADAAVYAHLARTEVRHGPPGLWAAAHAPALVAYYLRMRVEVGAAAAAAEAQAAAAGAAAPPAGAATVNEFTALADAVDARFAALAAAERGLTAASSSSAAAQPRQAPPLPPQPTPASSPGDVTSWLLVATGGLWGCDDPTLAAAGVDRLTAAGSRPGSALVRDAVVTAGIFAVAAVLLRAVARGGHV